MMDLLMDAELSDDDKTTTEQTLERYRASYDTFIKWQQSNGYETFEEDVLLAFFADIAKTVNGPLLCVNFRCYCSESSLFQVSIVDGKVATLDVEEDTQ